MENVGLADGIASGFFYLSNVISMSYLAAAILNFGKRPTSHNVGGVAVMSEMVKNVKAAVEIVVDWSIVQRLAPTMEEY